MTYKIVMPEDGWDYREVSFYCEVCKRNLVASSVYLNLDYLIQIGMTQAEFFQGLHMEGRHPIYAWNYWRKMGKELPLSEMLHWKDRIERAG